MIDGSKPRVLVVGSGLAGLLITDVFERRLGIKAVVWSAPEARYPASTRVAAGMFNPVSFRRLVPIWEANHHMALAFDTYKALEDKLGIPLWHERPLFKKFPNLAYRELWEERLHSNHPVSEWIEPQTWASFPDPGIGGRSGGWVPRAGYVDLRNLIRVFHACLREEGRLETREWSMAAGLPEGFDWVMDARGAGARRDLQAFGLDVRPNHGEVLTAEAPKGDKWPTSIVNNRKWLLPLADGRKYKLGATYRWDLQAPAEHEEAKHEILQGLADALPTLEFSKHLVAHESGIRPASPDRRPMVGRPDEVNRSWYHILNGLGTRGVLVGPRAAEELASICVENKGVQVHPDLDCKRFRTFKEQ